MAKARKFLGRADVKTFVLTVVAVMVAGLGMYFGRDIDLINKARSGYDK
tara:strand:- start:348 stop:494 length:147 start_codon:yes stop_codon:yes gene_type:complete